MINLPPAVIVHSLADAKAALAPGRALTLLSAPGAGQFAGCLWWRELLVAAGFAGPALLDCGSAPGRALEALHLGLGGVVLHAPAPAFSLVAQLAAAQGALALPLAPPALDLRLNGAIRRLDSWLDG
ncbi:hypothetical protein [Acidocella sp.]|uniref:hypothetical protein n=1 Tax=Acidocella sp. TaxID=50710 RepID=UPI0026044272|nr:hypothetical protein [Acidocella sp.]MDD2795595.1 hypothetical protein [Acidocella sp.]